MEGGDDPTPEEWGKGRKPTSKTQKTSAIFARRVKKSATAAMRRERVALLGQRRKDGKSRNPCYRKTSHTRTWRPQVRKSRSKEAYNLQNWEGRRKRKISGKINQRGVREEAKDRRFVAKRTQRISEKIGWKKKKLKTKKKEGRKREILGTTRKKNRKNATEEKSAYDGKSVNSLK